LEGNTINLAVRFMLEMSGLVTLGVWGWAKGDGVLKYVLALVVPLIAAAIWGIFAVPDDPSRSGDAPVIVPGLVRLVLELAFFTSVVWALFAMRQSMLGWLFGVIVVLHYLVSYERVSWLLRQ
jgi:hypothetical protein